MGTIKRKVELAPIVFLVYNRPEHTRLALEALMNNELADQSDLYIYADGPKANCSLEELGKIHRTRNILTEKKWCKNISISTSETNQGLAKSLVKAVTQIVNLAGKVIVLEDDMVTSAKFLAYMNDGLKIFSHDLSIGSIQGYSEKFVAESDFPTYFLLPGADCWGWATWKDRWSDFIFDASVVKKEIIIRNKVKEFEYGNHISTLDDQISMSVDTWDVQWHGTNVIYNRNGLYPKFSFIKNIGLDGTGTHCDPVENFNKGLILNKYEHLLDEYQRKNRIEFKKKIENKYKKQYKSKFKISIAVRIKQKFRSIASRVFRLIYKS